MIFVERFYLYRVELPAGRERWLVRAPRPAAPNPDGAACDLAELIAAAKAETLLRSALADAGQPSAPFELVFNTSSVAGTELGALHGRGQVSLWIAVDGESPREAFRRLLLVAAPDANIEAEIDRYLEVELFQFRKQRQPAQHGEVRLITEADYDLLDCGPFMVRDVLWLEREQGRRWLDEGAGAWVHPRPPTPARTQAELDAATLVLLERYLQELREAGALRSLAFELSELIPLGPAAGLAQLEALVHAREQLGEDWEDARWAIAHALVCEGERLGLGLDALRERWRAQPAFAEVLTELDEMIAEQELDDEP